VESFINPPNFANIRLGLSNIVIMYSLFYMGRKDALLLAVTKSVFVLLTRGFMAGILSFCGGALSLGLMVLLLIIFKEKISYLLLSIFGAIGHNIGQIVMAAILLKNYYFLYYLPVMVVSGILCGILTGVLLKYTMPYLKMINGGSFEKEF
ncbi:Gx transporter family protein, partial [Tyzzerella sp. OttesenSCG-928-J15]|nr:Gx transporter family protein [Tyzzerella sp. OttesenSCG-928-J15]